MRPAVWQIVAAALALGACELRRPLGPPRVDAGHDVAARDAIVESAPAPEAAAPVVCGGDGQPCCDGVCNLGLACDRPPGDPVGACTSACGHQDLPCCRGGGCQSGTACDTQDETGTCRPCGLPGLTCCRADCWIGVCLYENTPRMCVPCGKVGQPCCTFPDPHCDDGVRCDTPSQATASGARGTCVLGS